MMPLRMPCPLASSSCPSSGWRNKELAFAIVEREAAKYQLRLLEDAIDRLILARHAALCAREGTPP